MTHKTDDNKEKELNHKVLQGASAEVIQRYGNAVKQQVVAFTNTDNELSDDKKTLSKGLKSISKSKVNKEFKDQNIKQQTGFSAEVKSVARKNSDNIIAGRKERYIRTDDLLGKSNDPLIDIDVLDSDGNMIAGQRAQMKFVGKDPNDLLCKLRSNKYHKYLEADAVLDIADDDYDALIGKNASGGIIDNKIEELQKQKAHAEASGDHGLASEKQAQIDDCRKIKKNLRKSGLTRDEAIEARKHPVLSTAKDIAGISHKAGMEQAKTGAVISGSVSIVKNVVACIKGEQSPEEAAASVIKDTGAGAVFSYTTAFSGSALKGAMQNSSKTYVRALSETNLSSSLVSTTINIGKTVTRYLRGELTGAQCIESLGEQGVGEIGAAMYSAIALYAVKGTGSAVIKIAAGMAGSTLGYAAAVAVYQELATSLKEYELAKEERIRVEAECAEAVELICAYRAEMNAAVEKYLTEHLATFETGFFAIDNAVLDNDVDGFISGNTVIQEKLGHTVQFRTHAEFDALMSSEDDFKL